jgi:DNA-binding transcriptional ArsR family regulator
VKWIWIGLVSLAVVLTGLERLVGLAPVFLFLGALALGSALYFVWQSLLSVEGQERMDFDEALAFAVPTVAEEEKLAILRALKDLEYERTVGKISEEDYAAVLADYRARAKASIREADESLEKGRAVATEWARDWERERKEREASEAKLPPSEPVSTKTDAPETGGEL